MKIYKIIAFIIGIATVLFSQFILCAPDETMVCRGDFEWLSSPVGLMGVITTLVIFILFFLKDEIFTVWLKFFGGFLVLYFILVALAPAYTSDWIFPLTKETVSIIWSVVFLLISVILILYKSFKLRKNKD